MKTIFYFISIICTCFLLNQAVLGQKPEFKFGKIDMADLSATKCPIDSSADAYFLGDYGSSYFEYNQEKGFQTIFDHHFRIKILKKTALDWGNYRISLYRSSNGSGEEKVLDLKCATYNLEDGKVVTSKLEKSATFKEEVNKTRTNFRFSMPNVKEGSIIEISYKVLSDFYTLKDWYFQNSIPVLYTEYSTKIPEYLKYKVFQNGYERIKVLNTSENSSVTLHYKERSGGFSTATQTNFYQETVRFNTDVTTYIGENIKAFHNEPYMSSRKNFVNSLEIELELTKFPNSTIKTYTSSWESITERLMKDDDFGVITQKTGATNDIVETATKGITQPLNKAISIYNYIRDNFKWNNLDRLYASATIRKTIEAKSGNSADINLLLVAALKKADLDADPVVLSTRDNGIILMSYPLLQKLNYVIASVFIDGKRYLIDATDKFAPFGFVPDRCLNDQGRIISEKTPGVVDLTSNHSFIQNMSLMLKINENSELSGIWQETIKGYAANNFRESVDNSKSKEDFIAEKQKKLLGLTINSFDFKNLKDSLDKEVSIKYNISLSGQTESTGNLMMIHPMVTEQLTENPFKLEERKFPVDYSYKTNKTYVAQFEIPQGYQVETLPKAISMALPNKDASYVYTVATAGNKVQVVRRFSINKTLFNADEYPNLKEFYKKMVEKEAEVIVLKKL